jgi:hypothetical protein
MLTQGKSHFKQGGSEYEEEPADCHGICRSFHGIDDGSAALSRERTNRGGQTLRPVWLKDGSESVIELGQVNVDAERGWTTHGGIGEMLEAVPRIKVTNQIPSKTDGAGNLRRSPEVLRAKLISAEQSRAGANVHGDSLVRTAEGKARDHRVHESRVAQRHKLPGGTMQPHIEPHTGQRFPPSQWKAKDCGKVILLELF